MLQPYLEPVRLDCLAPLQSANRNVTTYYFPDAGLASMVAIGRGEPRQAQEAIIGREGLTGLPVVHGRQARRARWCRCRRGKRRLIVWITLDAHAMKLLPPLVVFIAAHLL